MDQTLFDLSGRVALVTGASKGLGKAIALALADAGADIALYGRDRSDLETVKANVEAIGQRAEISCADVLDKNAIDECVLGLIGSLRPHRHPCELCRGQHTEAGSRAVP